MEQKLILLYLIAFQSAKAYFPPHVLKLVYEVMKYRPDVIISAYPRVHLTVAVALSFAHMFDPNGLRQVVILIIPRNPVEASLKLHFLGRLEERTYASQCRVL